MVIRRIQVSNFKSFKDLDIQLGAFNVIVGANASGKSNFIQIFKFIKDIANLNLDNAISLQGSEYLSNIGVNFPQILSLKLKILPEVQFGFNLSDLAIAKIKSADYRFELKFEGKRTGFEIVSDSLTYSVDYVPWAKAKKELPKEIDIIGAGAIIIRNDNGKPKFNLKKPKDLKIKTTDVFPPFVRGKMHPKSLLLETPYFFFPPIERALSEIAIYDFDPKLSKKAVPVAGKFDLEEDGSNLSLVLKSIVEKIDKKRKFSNLIKDLLPFVDDLATDRFADKSLLFKLRENYFSDVYFPASFISDGTVNISAMLIALYFEEKTLCIIEEPERNIHPHLISKVMDMMKDAAENKQIIITTHNPEVVKHADLENILLVSRNKEGFSTITRPNEKKEVKIFLKNEMGLDELYVQDLLG